MPLYEYECQTEGNRFEVIQKFSDAPLTVCPTCGGPVRRLISSPAIQFKGSGWYITDYARKGSNGSNSSSSASSSSSGGNGSSSSSTSSDSSSSSTDSTKSSDSTKSTSSSSGSTSSSSN
jgi:putative FmdB family regulatory protein